LTLIVMVVAWLGEFNVLQRFALTKQIPTRNLLLTSGIFAFSYLVRTIIDSLAVLAPETLKQLQLSSCEEQNIKWAVLVFFLHFLGEVLPLSLLFWMQAKLYFGEQDDDSKERMEETYYADDFRQTLPYKDNNNSEGSIGSLLSYSEFKNERSSNLDTTQDSFNFRGLGKL